MYTWSQERDIVFFGMCNSSPIYMLSGGDYPSDTQRFTLVVDNSSWVLPAFRGEHGRGLAVDQREQLIAIRSAKHRIAFEVGTWRQELRPNAALESFAHDCPE
jgi:hypothetical protein